jgi:hypothetical protein
LNDSHLIAYETSHSPGAITHSRKLIEPISAHRLGAGRQTTDPPQREQNRTTPSIRSLIVVLGFLGGCGGPPYYESADEFARTHPATADLAFMSMTQGCPVEGASAPHLRKSFGAPHIIHTSDPGVSRWRFKLEERSSLEVLVSSDTIINWDIAGRPTKRIARDNYSWSISQAKGFPERAVKYLRNHPEVSSRSAFLMLRGCAAPGLSAEALRASWGLPSQIDSSADSAHWIYGYGVEGQHSTIMLVADTVRAYREVDPWLNSSDSGSP